MSRADLLILDEPTSGLDPLMDQVFRQCVLDAKGRGQTVLLSSHILSEVEMVCDRVAILRRGRLVETGTLAELRHLAAVSVDAVVTGKAPDLSRLPGVSHQHIDGQPAAVPGLRLRRGGAAGPDRGRGGQAADPGTVTGGAVPGPLRRGRAPLRRPGWWPVGAERPGLVVTRLLSRRALRSGLVWGLVFGLAVASSVEQFTTAYDTAESRRQIAGTIGGNGALRALFGSGRALETVPGWTAWRSIGIVTILGSIWALLAATRWLRGEEDSGRWELLVAGPTTRRRATAQAVAALGLGLVALWTATAAVILVVGREPEARFGIGESLFLAVALVAPAGVFLAVGAFASQLAPTRRQASRLAAAGFGVAFLLRVVGNSDPGLALGAMVDAARLGAAPPSVDRAARSSRWSRWSCSPAGLAVAAVALAGVRDVGAGVLGARDSARAPDRPAGRAGGAGGPAGAGRPGWRGPPAWPP